MEINMDPMRKQMLDDTFGAFSMLAGGNYVSLFDVKGKMTRYSPGAVELFGLPGEYIPDGAMDWADYVHPEDRKRYQDVMGKLIVSGTLTYDLTYRVRTQNGGYASFRAVGAVIRTEDGSPSMIGGMLINEGLVDNTDPTTILPNRYSFFADLGKMLQSGQRVVALLLGFSGLSRINETQGYSTGNRVLQQVGWLIQEGAGQRGTVYRMDGAAFAFLTTGLSEQEVSALYDSIRLKLQRGIRVDGVRLNLSANGGLISAMGLQMDPGTIYSCLTYARRESKERRHGELMDYNGSAGADGQRSLERLTVIRDAILEGCSGFSMEYQPVVAAGSGRPIGAEALVRWENGTYGRVPPLEFLPILEADFVFEELGSWILRAAMTDGLRLLEKDPKFVMGINIAPSQLEDEYFLDSLRETAEQTGFPLENLCLELTKGCRLLELDRLRQIVADLHGRGVRVLLDDFGSGLDSVGFLKRLAADFVKFDRDFLEGIEEDRNARETIRALADLASLHGTTVCAKGVETPGMRDILEQYPIRCLQGFLYAQPLSCGEFLDRYYS